VGVRSRSAGSSGRATVKMSSARVWLYLATAALVVAAAGIRLVPRNTDCEDQAVTLLLIESARMPLQPRWTGCFDRARDVTHLGVLRTPIQIRAAVASFELAWRNRSPRAGRNLGAALALSGATPRAISILTQVAATPTADTLSNLAAAYLVSAARTGNDRETLLALEHSSHALALAPDFAPALFNQALALSTLRIDDAADDTWRRYVELDADSSWGARARERLLDSNSRVSSAARFDDLFQRSTTDMVALATACADSSQTCRERLEESVLPEWGRAHLRGDLAAATTALKRARVLADALRNHGDSLDADVVAGIERAVALRSPGLADLASGIDSYGRARAAFEDDQPSTPLFVEAERRLAAAASPLIGWARCHRVYSEFNTYSGEKLADIGRVLSDWKREASSYNYFALAGRLAYLESISFVNRAEYAAADPLFVESIDALERADESDHLASTRIAVASVRLRLGENDAGWSELAGALELLPDIRSPRRQYVILLNVGMWLEERAMPHASIYLLSLARETALISRQVLRVAESSLYRAKAHAYLGDLRNARSDLDLARPDPEKNGQWGLGQRARYEYLAGLAEVETHARPDVAISAASEALDFFTNRAAPQRLALLYLIRGRAYAASGQRELAEQDFVAGIEAYSRYRDGLSSAQQRLFSQQVVWELYEERLRLAAMRSAPEALAASEQGRALTLIESGRRPRPPNSFASELQTLLDSETQVLYYALLPHQLLVWSISRDRMNFRQTPLSRQAIEMAATTLRDNMARSAPINDWESTAQDLFDTLVRPFLGAAQGRARLIVIPDGALHLVPFAALKDRQTKRFLVETHAVSIAPSGSLLTEGLSRTRLRENPQSLFIVGNPNTYGQSAPLPGAEREVESIASLYSHVQLVARDRATKFTFLNNAPRADVIHFAGHAVANPQFPLAAHLEFAGEAARAGSAALDASEIASMRLDRAQLVVLAACSTAGGLITRGEGVMSLARPFLAAGAAAVLATLWDIDDRGSAPFLEEFHRHFARSGNPSVALRDAQVAAISTMSPSVWASFSLIGGPARNIQRVED
jgi:CHAT domain-containing protein